jgi:hypothetical protein
MYITNTSFSPEAQSYAKDTHIPIWDGIKLSKTFFSMSIGRINDRSDEEPTSYIRLSPRRTEISIPS